MFFQCTVGQVTLAWVFSAPSPWQGSGVRGPGTGGGGGEGEEAEASGGLYLFNIGEAKGSDAFKFESPFQRKCVSEC